MDKYSTRRASKISTCILYQTAIFKEVFKSFEFNIYEALYKDLPDTTIAEKIIKLRKINNLEREEFAKVINYHFDTVMKWEVHNVFPKPESIKIICNLFNVPLEYFHDYYKVYYYSPNEIIRQWKIKNNFNYGEVTKLLNISHSGFARLLSGKISLSYEMYLKFKELEVF